ncbi:hypothetical protein [Oleiagrimonas soli]|uniref:Uncharacterized protein n=1 Tax=Oleiagrimonas soli TaxID=1543381 RepID=A0A841KQ20_9GAMM|nr:hypothetical protein [Oleiagrimonas soli]MBB6184064.1 hypothetical protein [Oleiagrimonas soli]
MKTTAALLVLWSALGAARATAGCPVTEHDLLGAWNVQGKAGFFEAFELEVASGTHVFDSWLHQRPDLSQANWKLEHCQLIVEPRDGDIGTFRFKILGLTNGRLRLYDASTRTESVYVRVPDNS